MGKRGTPTTNNSGRRTLGLECGCRQICIDADAWTLVVIKLCQAQNVPRQFCKKIKVGLKATLDEPLEIGNGCGGRRQKIRNAELIFSYLLDFVRLIPQPKISVCRAIPLH